MPRLIGTHKCLFSLQKLSSFSSLPKGVKGDEDQAVGSAEVTTEQFLRGLVENVHVGQTHRETQEREGRDRQYTEEWP